MTGKLSRAQWINEEIKSKFQQLDQQTKQYRPKTAYFIWQKPYLTVGNDTFISEMMNLCGFVNIFADSSRYPQTTLEELVKKNCELLLLSSEPFPFKEKHIAEINSHVPKAKIHLVDGEMFSWYGSRLMLAPAYFQQLLAHLGK